MVSSDGVHFIHVLLFDFVVFDQLMYVLVLVQIPISVQEWW